MSPVTRPKQDDALSIDQILRQLRDGPRLIGAMTSGLSPSNLRLRPTPDEWSINDNLAHLRASADVWGTYMGRIVAEDNPMFTSINPRAYYGDKLARHEAVHLPQIAGIVSSLRR